MHVPKEYKVVTFLLDFCTGSCMHRWNSRAKLLVYVIPSVHSYL